MLGKCDCHLRLSPSFVMENRHFTNTAPQTQRETFQGAECVNHELLHKYQH